EAVLFVSHDMDAIKRICTRVVWIDQGRIHLTGDPNTVVDGYIANLFRGRETQNDTHEGALETLGTIVDLRLASEPGKPIGALQLSEDGFIEGLVHLRSGGIAARLRLRIQRGKQVVFTTTSPWAEKSRKPRNQSLAVCIPSHFFNEG